MSSTDSPRVSIPKSPTQIARITATAEINTNTPVLPHELAATAVTRNGKKILLKRPTALQNPDPDNFADVGHISGTYTAEA